MELLSKQVRSIRMAFNRDDSRYKSVGELADKIAQLEAENRGMRKAALGLLGMIDCIGGRWSLDDASPDRKYLAEIVNYPAAIGDE